MPVDQGEGNDPFSLAYNGQWKLIERNYKLQELLPVGNRIKFDKPNPRKDEVSHGDLPELQLIPSGITGRSKDSTSRIIRINYQWLLSTGSYKLHKDYNRILWELYRSLEDWECVLCSLSWCNCNFIERYNITSSEEGTAMQELNREIQGFACVITCEMQMVFSKANLKIRSHSGITPVS